MRKLKVNLTETEITFEQGFKEFIDNCKARNLRQGTITHYKEFYNSMQRFIDKDTVIKDITKETVDNFIINCSNLNVRSQTIYSYARDLKTILKFFMRMDYVKTFKIELPKVDKSNIETYTDEELKILLKKPNLKNCTFVEYRDWTIINFLLSTGIRLNSLINIKVKDIDFENEVVYINVTKNRKPLIIPLNSIILKILREYLKIRQYKDIEEYLFCTAYNKQLNKRTMNGSLIKYNRDRGVVKTGIHRYRHTFAKKWIISGGNVVTLQKILGHSSLNITQNYINILVTDLAGDIEKFNILNEFTSDFIKLK